MTDWLHETERKVLVFDVAGALLVHLIYKIFEVEPGKKLLTGLLLFGVPVTSAYFLHQENVSAVLAVILSFGVFFSTLVTSIVTYRISPFHPLAKYPGPLLAKISRLQGTRMMAKGRNHLYYKELHAQYGPIIRVGPNEISVADASFIPELLGANGLPRGPLWDGRRNPFTPRNLIAIRDQQEHSRRRKPWNRAFSTSAVKDLEQVVLKRASQLMHELEKLSKKDERVNLSEWMRALAYDVMGDMVFGGGFESMRDGAQNEVIMNVIEGGLKVVACVQTIPWITSLLFQLPGASRSVFKLRDFARDTVERRTTEGSQRKDVYYYLMDEDKILSDKERMSPAEAVSDAVMAIVAGYDTTATVLTGILYFIIKHAHVHSRLREEIDEHFQKAGGDSLNSSKLGELPYLSAVINETLRLANPASTLQRGTTSETGGRWLGSNYVPKNTAIDIPMHTIFRDPKYFSPAPEEFRPERFLSAKDSEKSEAATNMAAFIPFSFGPENCAGRNLAIIELRVITALMVRQFDMKFASGYDQDEWPNSMEDYFVMKVGPLPVVIKSRGFLLEFS